MAEPIVRKYGLNDPQQCDNSQDFWRNCSGEERLSAVEVLRRQFGKFPKGEGYDGSARLRRVLRIVQ